MKFATVVWIRDGELGVSPIATLEEAAEFLANLPDPPRDPYAYIACKSIASARAGHIAPDQAKQHFLDYCEEAGLLAQDKTAR